MSFSDLVDKVLKEKAESKAQRRLMGWARACNKGEAECPERVKNVAKSFKDKAELKKYAKTKEKGLPEKKHPEKTLGEQELEEGPAYGAGLEDMVAWTGGSSPPPWKEMDIKTKKLVRQMYKQQMGEYASGWGEEPDDDTKGIFWNRAMHDAWATMRVRESDELTWADLDSENILREESKKKSEVCYQTWDDTSDEEAEKVTKKDKKVKEAELSTSPASPGPDKDGTPHFEKQPADAGEPEWHEPKPDFDSIEHRSNLRGVIQAGVDGDMANKAYKNGSQNNPKYSKKPYKEAIRINHPVKGNGTVVVLTEGYVTIEWDSLNLRPLGPETLTKEEAQYVTVGEAYSKDPEEAEMGPKAKKKKDDKEEVEEGNVVQMGGERKSQDVMSPIHIKLLRNRFANIKTIDPEQPTYGKLTAMLDDASDALLTQLANADINFVSMLAQNRMMKRGLTEDQYEQQPSFQVAPPPAMTIFQDQDTDEDWSADPLATQRGAEAAGQGDAPEGEMEQPDDAPDDLNIDHQELPDSGRAEQIAGEVFGAFDGEGGSSNEIDYKSDQVDFVKQSDNSHNKQDSGEAQPKSDDSGDSEGGEKKSFPAQDKSEDKDNDSEEKEPERDKNNERDNSEEKDTDSEDKSNEREDSEDDDKKEKAEESLSLKDFDVEGILD